MELHGKVAILNEAQNAVQEIRDLGPSPVPVKDGGRVRAFVEAMPAHDAATERLIGYTDQIATTVTRTWAKAAIDFVGEDTAALNAALLEPGSVLRAVVAVMRDEINILRTHAAIGLAPRTTDQVKNALRAKMR